MEKTTCIYFGDDLFQKLYNFVDEKSISIESMKFKVFNSVKSSTITAIDDIYLGWSYIVYRIGNKFYHVGFSCSRGGSTEVFKSQNKDFNITCGANKVYAFSRGGDIFYYSTQNLEDTSFYTSNTKQKIKDFSTGDCHSVVLCDDGTVSLLTLHEKTSLIPIHLQPAITQVSCGKEHVILLSETGQVFSYGCGSHGQLGHGTIENVNNPILLEALDGIKIKSISCGGWHSAAISDAGDLYVWGWNESGQLGFPCAELHGNRLSPNEIETICCFPKIVEFEEEKMIVSVSCGTRHTAVMTENFQVWSWGWNEYGQLGHSKHSLCDKPCKISLPSTFIPKKIRCAFWSTLIVGTLTI